MSVRRPRSSPDSVLDSRDSPQSSDFDDQVERSPAQPRQTSIRMSRRVDGAGQTRLAATSRTESNADGRRPPSSSFRRIRRPTPIVRHLIGRNDASPSTDEDQRDETTTRQVTYQADTENNHHDREPSGNNSSRRHQDLRHTSGNRNMRGSLMTRNYAGHHHGGPVTVGRHYSQLNGLPLTWYERLMPEFLLHMTAPITGYEARLDSDVDDVEYEILERQRLKRNRKIRRRLLSVILIAGVAGLFMYTRGKMFRKLGVKATASSLKHRLEDGLARSIQETMGK